MHELNLVELVHTNNTAVVSTGTSCFSSKTWRVGRHFDRKIIFGEESVAVKVGNRNFGGWSEEEFVVLRSIHIVFKFWKLAGSFHTLAFDDVGDIDFLVSVFAALDV